MKNFLTIIMFITASMVFASENLLVNGSFEIEPGQYKHVGKKLKECTVFNGWRGNFYVEKNGSFKVTDEKAVAGTWSLKVNLPDFDSVGQLMSERFPVKPSGLYQASWQFFSDDPIPLDAAFRWFDKNEKLIKNWSHLRGKTISRGKWVKSKNSQAVRAPKEAVAGQLYFKLKRGPRDIYIDNVAVVEVTEDSSKQTHSKVENMYPAGRSFEVWPASWQTAGMHSSNMPRLYKAERDGSTSIDGKYSLKLDIAERPEGYGPFLMWLKYHNLPGFKTDKVYTMSVYAKADKPCVMYLGLRGPGWKWPIGEGNSQCPSFVLTKEWKRYSASFRMQPVAANDYRWSWIQFRPLKKDTSALKIWIDAAQMEPGKLSPFIPAKNVQISIKSVPYIERRGVFYTDEENVAFQGQVYCSEGLENEHLRYRLIDVYKDCEIASGPVPYTKNGSKHGSYDLKIKNPGRGYFHLWVESGKNGKILGRQESVFGVITRNENRNFDPDSPFGMACSNGWYRHWGGINVPKKSKCYVYGYQYTQDPDFVYRLMSDIGVKWLRDFSLGYFWREIEYEKGKFRWGSDVQIDRARKYGMELLAILWGGGGTVSTPDWVKKSGRKNNTKHFGMHIPEIHDWERYVRAFTEHYKDKILAYEVLNEPNSGMEEDEYMPLLKSAYKVIKEINPQAIVVGVCATGDYGSPIGWMTECIKRGAAKYSDALSIHYGLTANYKLSSLETATQRGDLMRAANRPVWNTECGTRYLTAYEREQQPVLDTRISTALLPAKDQPSLFLTEQVFNMVETGRDKFFFFNNCFPVGDGIACLLHDDLTPKPQLVAYDVMADMLNDFKSGKRVKTDGHLRAYLFDRKTRSSVAVLWNSDIKRATIECVVNCSPEQLLATNPVGQLIKLEKNSDGKTVLPIGPEAFYLESVGMENNEFASLLDNMKSDMISNLVPNRLAVAYSEKTGPLAIAWGDTLKPMDISLNLKTPHFIKANPDKLTVKAKQRGIFKGEFPLSINVAELEDFGLFECKMSSGRERVAISKTVNFMSVSPVSSSITLDGDLSEWKKAKWYSMAHRQFIVEGDSSMYKGKKDLKGDLALMYDDKHIYIAAKVTDDVVMQKYEAESGQLWKNDAFELYFDFDLLGDISGKKPDGDDLKLDMAPGSGTAGKAKFTLKRKSSKRRDKYQTAAKEHVDVYYQKTKDGYIIELKLNVSEWNAPLKPGGMIGFTYSVRDQDDDEGVAYKHFNWTKTSHSYRDTSTYARLIFK